MTSQGTAHGRFTRAIKTRNLWAAEIALRELGTVSLDDALGYLDLLAEQKPEKLAPRSAGNGRLEVEPPILTLAESQLALAALASLVAGERDAVEVLRRLLRRVRQPSSRARSRSRATPRARRWSARRQDRPKGFQASDDVESAPGERRDSSAAMRVWTSAGS